MLMKQRKSEKQKKIKMNNKQDEAMFAGVIGEDYEMLKLVCPLAAEMSRLVGQQVSLYSAGGFLEIIELGGGTGITTLAILGSQRKLHLTSVDNEPMMQNQAKQKLHNWVADRVLCFQGDDALSALQASASNSVDIIASAYTIHNFHADYRNQVIAEIFRVLKPGGLFINGDRYALDDISAHTQLIQKEVAGYFSIFTEIDRLDLLEHWIVHLFSDESENHIMRETEALQQLENAGFTEIKLAQRMEVNALVTATKA